MEELQQQLAAATLSVDSINNDSAYTELRAIIAAAQALEHKYECKLFTALTDKKTLENKLNEQVKEILLNSISNGYKDFDEKILATTHINKAILSCFSSVNSNTIARNICTKGSIAAIIHIFKLLPENERFASIHNGYNYTRIIREYSSRAYEIFAQMVKEDLLKREEIAREIAGCRVPAEFARFLFDGDNVVLDGFAVTIHKC